MNLKRTSCQNGFTERDLSDGSWGGRAFANETGAKAESSKRWSGMVGISVCPVVYFFSMDSEDVSSPCDEGQSKREMGRARNALKPGVCSWEEIGSLKALDEARSSRRLCVHLHSFCYVNHVFLYQKMSVWDCAWMWREQRETVVVPFICDGQLYEVKVAAVEITIVINGWQVLLSIFF